MVTLPLVIRCCRLRGCGLGGGRGVDLGLVVALILAGLTGPCGGSRVRDRSRARGGLFRFRPRLGTGCGYGGSVLAVLILPRDQVYAVCGGDLPRYEQEEEEGTQVSHLG